MREVRSPAALAVPIIAGQVGQIALSLVDTVIIVVAYWAADLPGAWLAAFVLKMTAPGIWVGMAAGLAVAAVALSIRVLLQTSARRTGF
jgi:MATE family multidrug resistance protein